MSRPMQNILETVGLTKTYGEVHALEDCSLSIQKGEIFGLLGPNGSGKTTLLRMLMGYLQPTTGRAYFHSTSNPARRPLDCYQESVEVHRLVSYMPAEVRLFPNMNGRDVLRFFSDMHPLGDFRRSIDLARRLELDLSRTVAYCSTGMKQKIALVSTLAPRTPLIILDEPTSALDPTVRREVLMLLSEAQQEGQTVLLSSHVLSEVEASCDRVCILRKGKIAFLDALANIQREHRIHAIMTGSLPALPTHLKEHARVFHLSEREVQIRTAGELRDLFGWLSNLPMEQIRVEPVSLQVVYDRYHLPNGKEADG